MKPHLLKIGLSPTSSFSLRHDVVPFFFDRWHYHAEAEIVFIKEGNGTEFIGDNIRAFDKGDLILIGSGLPHYWHCASEYYQDGHTDCEAVVAHFNPSLLGDKFLDLPENKVIRELLLNSSRGILVDQSIRPQIVDLLCEMFKASDCKKLLLLLSALEIIATSQHKLLCSEGFVPHHDPSQTESINQVYTYSVANFHRKITLEEIAAVAHLSPNSFCRHFKSHTRKTYSEFLHELRVGHACKLLIENQLTIGHICDASGFNTFANFYRYFKLITGKTPQQFQQLYNRRQAA